MLTISVDDGSTNAKVSWFDGQKIQTIINPNSFRKGWKSAALRTDKVISNYLIGETKYTYDMTSDKALETTHIDYQYSDLNLLSVHHALLKTGIKPQPVKIVATLPITAYYNADDCQKNEVNIERKKKNLMRPILLNKGELFKVVAVEVMPESVPAVLSTLVESNINEFSRTLVIDIGGTSVDSAVIVGKFDEISNIYGNNEIGVGLVTNTARLALANADSDASFLVANELIKNRHNIEFVKEVVNDLSQVNIVLKKIEDRINELGQTVAEEMKKFCKNPNRVYIVGGGAPLVYSAIKEAYSTLGDRVTILANAETALAKENMLYALSDTEIDVDVEVDVKSVKSAK